MKNENHAIEEANQEIKDSFPRPQFLTISLSRLIFLSIITGGLYKLYWFYKNWEAISDSGKRLFPGPFFRSVFAPFFAYGLFKRIYDDSSDNGYKGYYSPGWLTVLYWMLILTNTILSTRYGIKYPIENFSLRIMYISSVVALIPVQKAINFRGVALKKDFSTGELIVIALGIASITLTILVFSGITTSLLITG